MKTLYVVKSWERPKVGACRHFTSRIFGNGLKRDHEEALSGEVLGMIQGLSRKGKNILLMHHGYTGYTPKVFK